MEDWESEDFEPVVQTIPTEKPKGLWDDEDVEEEDVKESWEDEEDASTKAPKPVAPKPDPPAQKTVPKTSAKAGGKKEKVSEAEKANEVLADPVAEKLRQQRLIEEADYRSTAELFAKKDDEKSLNNFIPKSESDFSEYAELISHKLLPYEKSFHYIGLLKAVMRLSMTSMKAADAKEVASSITAIANEKLKAEKEANAGKKKQTKKKQLHVDKPDDDAVVDHYDALDDYDFM